MTAPKGFLITQFDHRDVEVIGLPKLDLLGIRALTVLADAANLVRRDHDPSFRVQPHWSTGERKSGLFRLIPDAGHS